MRLQGKKADLIARLGPALEAEAAERERQREVEEKARLEEEERQRQLQLEQKAKQEEEDNAEDRTSPAVGEQTGGEEEEYQEQYTEDGNTEAGTGSAPADDTPPKSEVCLAWSLRHCTSRPTHGCTACMGLVYFTWLISRLSEIPPDLFPPGTGCIHPAAPDSAAHTMRLGRHARAVSQQRIRMSGRTWMCPTSGSLCP